MVNFSTVTVFSLGKITSPLSKADGFGVLHASPHCFKQLPNPSCPGSLLAASASTALGVDAQGSCTPLPGGRVLQHFSLQSPRQLKPFSLPVFSFSHPCLPPTLTSITAPASRTPTLQASQRSVRSTRSPVQHLRLRLRPSPGRTKTPWFFPWMFSPIFHNPTDVVIKDWSQFRKSTAEQCLRHSCYHRMALFHYVFEFLSRR